MEARPQELVTPRGRVMGEYIGLTHNIFGFRRNQS